MPKPKSSGLFASMVVKACQLFAIVLVGCGLVMIGFLLFRDSLLERYFEKKTGYVCEIDSFDLDLRLAMIELHDVVVWNKAPFPDEPLAEIRSLRIEWDPKRSNTFPRKLGLLEVSIDRLSIIRLDGNQFNIHGFVESIVRAWGTVPEEARRECDHALEIAEVWISWDYMLAYDQEAQGGKRMEVFLEYDAVHQDVKHIHEITDPAIETAREHADGFFFFQYMQDSIKSLLN